MKCIVYPLMTLLKVPNVGHRKADPMTPSLSVLFCVYNGENYLNEAVRSILTQTFSDFEMVVVDDGSTDATSTILDSFVDSRIVRLRNATNRGLVASLNVAIAHSHGKYLVRMDADDFSLPDRFQHQFDYMELHPEVGVLGCWMEQIDEESGYREILKAPSEHHLIRWKMLFETVVFHATVMMRRDLVISEGGYDEHFLHIEDTELWSRLILVTRFANLEEVLYVRRWHSASICNLNFQEQFRIGAELRHKMLENIAGRVINLQLIESYSQKLTIGHFLGVFERLRLVVVFVIAAKNYCLNFDKDATRQIWADLSVRLKSLFDFSTLARSIIRRVKRFLPDLFLKELI